MFPLTPECYLTHTLTQTHKVVASQVFAFSSAWPHSHLSLTDAASARTHTHTAILCHTAEGSTAVRACVCVCHLVNHKELTIITTIFLPASFPSLTLSLCLYACTRVCVCIYMCAPVFLWMASLIRWQAKNTDMKS